MSRKVAAMLCRTGQMYEELQDYALSTWGPDSERMGAAQYLSEKGILSDEEPVELFLRGEWKEILLLNQEITFEPEPDVSLPEEVQDMIGLAHEAVLDGDYEESEELARKGLELLPNHPPLMNFVAASLYGMKRRQEADEVTRQMFEIHPDYLFARTGMAEIYLREKKIEEAQEMLEPYVTQKKFHISEFAALTNVRFGIAMARGEDEAAESLINMMRAIDSEHPLVYAMERHLKKPRLLR
jgi:tetratricopeptide (TPR) repeat protein